MCGYCGFCGFIEFQNRKNRRNLILYSKNIPFDFQGESILQKISTDFLRLFVNMFVGKSVKKYEL